MRLLVYNKINMVKIKQVKTKNIFSKTSFRGYSYVINPYTGCASGCIYCHACFIQNFTNHQNELWGDFVDVKRWDGVVRTKRTVVGRNMLMRTITDPYNPVEEKYENTKQILERLREIGCNLTVCTRSDLVLRDIKILKEMNARVCMSVNSFDEIFVRQTEPKTTPIEKRLKALKELHKKGIYTILSISPIFPYITDFEEIVEKTRDYVDEYWFENLNLRQPYKLNVLNYIYLYYPELDKKYTDIYIKKDPQYWFFLRHKIIKYCRKHKLTYKIDFRYS